MRVNQIFLQLGPAIFVPTPLYTQICFLFTMLFTLPGVQAES